MLLMGWGGESTASMELAPWLHREIRRSNKEIKALGIIHEDLRRDNVLWNEELGRALIIDFHRSTLKYRPTLQQSRAVKRQLCQPETGDPKRLRATWNVLLIIGLVIQLCMITYGEFPARIRVNKSGLRSLSIFDAHFCTITTLPQQKQPDGNASRSLLSESLDLPITA